MIKVGKRQKLVINNFSSVGAYLFAGTDDDKDNILLPNNELEGKDLKEGDEVEVLIYRDSEDRLIATFRKTEALVGTLAKLEVVDDNPRLGAFLDWGLNKDLMLPNSQKETKVEIGKRYLVGLYEDSKGRMSATMKIYKFLMPSNDIKKGDIVNATVYRINNEISFSNILEEKTTYDLKIDMGDLVFLITGYFSIDELIKLGKIDIKNKNVIKNLNKIFFKKNSYLYEFI